MQGARDTQPRGHASDSLIVCQIQPCANDFRNYLGQVQKYPLSRCLTEWDQFYRCCDLMFTPNPSIGLSPFPENDIPMLDAQGKQGSETCLFTILPGPGLFDPELSQQAG